MLQLTVLKNTYKKQEVKRLYYKDREVFRKFFVLYDMGTWFRGGTGHLSDQILQNRRFQLTSSFSLCHESGLSKNGKKKG